MPSRYLTFCNTTNWLNICTSFNLEFPSLASININHSSIKLVRTSISLYLWTWQCPVIHVVFQPTKLIFFFLSQTPMNPGNLAPVVTRTSKNMAEAARVSGGLIDFLTRVLYWCCLFFFSIFYNTAGVGYIRSSINDCILSNDHSINLCCCLVRSICIQPQQHALRHLINCTTKINLTEVFNSVSPCAS